METSTGVSQKPENRTSMWPSNFTSGYIYLKKKSKPVTWRDTCTSVFIVALFTTAKVCKQPRWMDKEGIVHTYNGILFSHKKDIFFLFAATWTHLEAIMLSEIKGHPGRHRGAYKRPGHGPPWPQPWPLPHQWPRPGARLKHSGTLYRAQPLEGWWAGRGGQCLQEPLSRHWGSSTGVSRSLGMGVTTFAPVLHGLGLAT